MKFRTALLTMTAAVSLGAAQAHACEFKPEDAQKHIDEAKVIFVGAVTGTQKLSGAKSGVDPEYKTMFNSEKAYKGRAGGVVNVIQMHDAWGEYITFKTGAPYLILADRNDYGLLINGCSPVMSLDRGAIRSGEPGDDYKAAVAKALKDDTLFPELGAVASSEVAPAEKVAEAKTEAPAKPKAEKTAKKKPAEPPAEDEPAAGEEKGAE
jgi:hypothetical protein